MMLLNHNNEEENRMIKRLRKQMIMAGMAGIMIRRIPGRIAVF